MMERPVSDDEAGDRAIILNHELLEMLKLLAEKLQAAALNETQWRIISFELVENRCALFGIKEVGALEQLAVKDGVNAILDFSPAVDVRLPVAHQMTQFFGLLIRQPDLRQVINAE